MYVQKALENSEKGHDWWHIYRVWKIAKVICQTENVDQFVVELGALLHDIADSKFNGGNEEIGPLMAKSFLQKENLESEIIERVVYIVRNVSYRGNTQKIKSDNMEFKIVQDADKLDGMGAIGIARCFNFGGFMNREIYNPNIKPIKNMSKEEYKNNIGTSINHFYEKLLLLPELMHTKTGKKMAKDRRVFMVKYLKRFFAEWEGDL